MQILGLSESTPKSENRLKSLFWPRIQYPEDVEYLGAQGYWVCVVIALFTLLAGVFSHRGLSTSPDVLYFYLAGVGIRRRSRFAAVSAFAVYLLIVFASVWIAHSGGVLSIFFLALLLSNVRATWIAHRFVAEQPLCPPQLLPPASLLEKFTDTLPRVVWPVGRWFYYALALMEVIGVSAILLRGPAPLPPS